MPLVSSLFFFNFERMRWKILKKVFSTLAIIYVAGGLAMYFLQELFMFHPKSLPKDYVFHFDQAFTEINLATADNRNLNIVEFHAAKPKGIVLYFHGNRQNIERYAKYAPYFTRNNYVVWMVDYPGYGKSTGQRSEQAMYSDALLLYERALRQTRAEYIIIYGKSLGTGVAAFLASKKQCKKLILETPYYSMKALAHHYFPIYPTDKLTRYCFPTNEYLKTVHAPVSIFHGTADEIIPFQHSQKLKKENPGIELIPVVKGKHNNLYNFPLVTQKLDALLQ